MDRFRCVGVLVAGCKKALHGFNDDDGHFCRPPVNPQSVGWRGEVEEEEEVEEEGLFGPCYWFINQ